MTQFTELAVWAVFILVLYVMDETLVAQDRIGVFAAGVLPAALTLDAYALVTSVGILLCIDLVYLLLQRLSVREIMIDRGILAVAVGLLLIVPLVSLPEYMQGQDVLLLALLVVVLSVTNSMLKSSRVGNRRKLSRRHSRLQYSSAIAGYLFAGALAAMLYPDMGLVALLVTGGVFWLIRQSLAAYLHVATAHEELVEALGDAIDEAIGFSGHSSRVASICLRASGPLSLSLSEAEELVFAARLHDIGAFREGELDDGGIGDSLEVLAECEFLSGAARVIETLLVNTIPASDEIACKAYLVSRADDIDRAIHGYSISGSNSKRLRACLSHSSAKELDSALATVVGG